jgi:hypothetical protein
MSRVSPKILLPFALLASLVTLGCESGRAEGQPAKSTAAPPTATAAGTADKPARPAQEHAPGTVALGAPIRSTNAVALSSIAQDATKYANQTVKTEGRVTAVCQAMGCWMEIADTDSTAHIRMTGHSFFIPKDASGRRAVLEGTVLAKPDNGECEEEAKQATGRMVKVEIDATGVELL